MDKLSPITLAATGCTLIVTSVAVYKVFFSGSKDSSTASKEVVEEVEDTRPKLNIYFGSQTGTAEGLCRVVEREGKERGFNCEVIDLEVRKRKRFCTFSSTTMFNDSNTARFARRSLGRTGRRTATRSSSRMPRRLPATFS